ncbi:peptide deformylase [Candidatus Wolfebacteria bacterium]|nr:peptide deformylase [Candidatus Wolfebacteria bacterium]
MTKKGIWTIEDKKEEKFLRRKTSDFDFSKKTKKEINEFLKLMREKMMVADGIGLSANQIGIDTNVFVACVDNKFYAVFNPKFSSISEEKVLMEEGCLSVPNIFGNVWRPEKVVLEGFDKNGKKIKIKAWGILARVFQHEVDHLNGILFIDKAEDLHKYEIQSVSDKEDKNVI